MKHILTNQPLSLLLFLTLIHLYPYTLTSIPYSMTLKPLPKPLISLSLPDLTTSPLTPSRRSVAPLPCHPSSIVVVNNTHDLGPVKELAFLANETSATLHNLTYSMRYKFYLNAKTVIGAGPSISQEAVTIMDEGKSC